MKKYALIFLAIAVVGCSAAPKNIDVDTVNVLSFDGNNVETSGGSLSLATLPDISTIVPENVSSEGGESAVSSFSFSGKSSSFTYSANASTLSAGNKATSFALSSNASSGFSSAVPPPSSSFGGATSKSCNWESPLRNFFQKMFSESGAGKTSSIADAQLEAIISGMRPHLSSAAPVATCIIASFYQCIADNFKKTETVATEFAKCAQNACIEATGNSAQCSTISATAGTSGEKE